MRMKSIVSLKNTIGSMNFVTKVKYIVFLASLDIYLKSSIHLQNIRTFNKVKQRSNIKRANDHMTWNRKFCTFMRSDKKKLQFRCSKCLFLLLVQFAQSTRKFSNSCSTWWQHNDSNTFWLRW